MSLISNSTAATSGTSSSLFGNGGIFGSQGGAAGLFGMLMSLFGQSQGQTGTAAGADASSLLGGLLGGQNHAALSALQSQANGLSVNLADGNAINFADLQLLDASTLTSFLQQMANSPEASPLLRNFLGDGAADLAALQQKFETLNPKDQQDLMSEMAALLMPMLPQITPEALTVNKENTDLPIDADANNITNANTLAQQHTQNNLAQNAIDKTTQQAKLDASALAAAAQSTANNKVQSDRKEQDKAIAAATQSMSITQQTSSQDSANTSNILQDALNKAAALQNNQSAKSINKSTPVGDDRNSTTETTVQNTQTVSTVDTPRAVSPTTAERTAIALGNAKSSAISLASDAMPLTEKGSEAANLNATAVQSNTQAASFKDHLASANLNRNGAHIPVSEQVAVQLTHALKNGQDQVTIKLSPADLGRIEVKLDMSQEGRVTASFSVDQPATLDLLQRDQRGLEKAFSDIGLKADQGALSFNLRNDNQGQQSFAQMQDNSGNNNQNSNSNNANFGSDASRDETIPAGLIEMVWHVSPDRIDVRI